jgi:hypothetical protein
MAMPVTFAATTSNIQRRTLSRGHRRTYLRPAAMASVYLQFPDAGEQTIHFFLIGVAGTTGAD